MLTTLYGKLVAVLLGLVVFIIDTIGLRQDEDRSSGNLDVFKKKDSR